MPPLPLLLLWTLRHMPFVVLWLWLPSCGHWLTVFKPEMLMLWVGDGHHHLRPLWQDSIATEGITVIVMFVHGLLLPLPSPSPWLIVFLQFKDCQLAMAIVVETSRHWAATLTLPLGLYSHACNAYLPGDDVAIASPIPKRNYGDRQRCHHLLPLCCNLLVLNLHQHALTQNPS